MEITDVLREYQLIFLRDQDFFYRLFGLRRMCEDTFWDFSQDYCLFLQV